MLTRMPTKNLLHLTREPGFNGVSLYNKKIAVVKKKQKSSGRIPGMSLFSKSTLTDGLSSLGVSDLIKSTGNKNSQESAMSNSSKSPKTAASYGIQQAIDLINTLPDASPELMIPVVIKTLESVNIRVEDIIGDATEREEVIESNSIELITKIESLEAEINSLNDQVMTLNTELESITHVRSLLLDSMIDDEDISAEELAREEAKLAALEEAEMDAAATATAK
jgi:hypothetical protein